MFCLGLFDLYILDVGLDPTFILGIGKAIDGKVRAEIFAAFSFSPSPTGKACHTTGNPIKGQHDLVNIRRLSYLIETLVDCLNQLPEIFIAASVCLADRALDFFKLLCLRSEITFEKRRPLFAFGDRVAQRDDGRPQ